MTHLSTKLVAVALLSMGAIFNMAADEVRVNKVNIPVFKKQNPNSGGILKSPIDISIEASFDYSTGDLTVFTPEDVEGYVYVYTLEGALEASSNRINCTLTIPSTSDIHIISIQGDEWTGEAKIIY